MNNSQINIYSPKLFPELDTCITTDGPDSYLGRPLNTFKKLIISSQSIIFSITSNLSCWHFHTPVLRPDLRIHPPLPKGHQALTPVSCVLLKKKKKKTQNLYHPLYLSYPNGSSGPYPFAHKHKTTSQLIFPP